MSLLGAFSVKNGFAKKKPSDQHQWRPTPFFGGHFCSFQLTTVISSEKIVSLLEKKIYFYGGILTHEEHYW
jgi:hypothetical protein